MISHATISRMPSRAITTPTIVATSSGKKVSAGASRRRPA